MSKQTLVILLVAAGLFVVGVIGAIAFSGGDDGSPVMTMPNGETMPENEMTGVMTMTNGETMPETQMTETMP